MATINEKIDAKTKEVQAFLKMLGGGPNKIATALKTMKIKGFIAHAGTCPVARAIKKKFKSFEEIGVCGDVIVFNYYGGCAEIDTPKAIFKFIEKFDDGFYPELVDVLYKN